MKTKLILAGLALLVGVAVMAVFATGQAAAGPPTERDFFGTVLSVENSLVRVLTNDGIVEVPTSENILVRLPLNQNGTLDNLAEGDRVAVSLENTAAGLVADKLFVIPGKTRFRHVPGEVIGQSDTHITIRPLGQGAVPITFTLSPSTAVNVRPGLQGLTDLDSNGLVGTFVVIGAVRDQFSGELLSIALEINVTAGKPPVAVQEVAGAAEGGESASTGVIQGVFEGVSNGNLIIDGAEVAVDGETVVNGGIVAGQGIKIEVVLQPNGLPLARVVEAKELNGTVSGTTRLEGVFQGVGPNGWIISGTEVIVGPGTDTDGLPTIGQNVRVKALYQENGTLLAREIENKGGLVNREEKNGRVKLEGTFTGVDASGNWIINGAPVSVDPLTRLNGTPRTGERVEIRAILQENGELLASVIEAEGNGRGGSKSEAKINGEITEVIRDQDNLVRALVINGQRVAISNLTELEGEIRAGNYVEVEALIQDNGALVAREVESKAQPSESGNGQFGKVNIRGTITNLGADGASLEINGIPVVISALTEVQGEITNGALIKVEGVMLHNGFILASKLKGEGRQAAFNGTEVNVEGPVEMVNRDSNGRIVSVVVNGRPIAVEALTDLQGNLRLGNFARIQGIVSNGQFVAGRIEGLEARPPGSTAETKIQGLIESLQRDSQGQIISITVNGVAVSIDSTTELSGNLVAGQGVKIEGIIKNGIVHATEVNGEGPGLQGLQGISHPEFAFLGTIDSVERDNNGNVVNIIVNGRSISVEALTQLKGLIEAGATVKINGVLSGETFVAREVDRVNGVAPSRGLASVGTVLAQGVNAVPAGPWGLKTYRVEQLTLAPPMKVVVKGQEFQAKMAWRVTITGDHFPVRAAPPFIWIDGVVIGVGLESPDQSEISVITFDFSLLRDGAAIALSYSLGGEDRQELPEKLSLQGKSRNNSNG